MNGMMQMASRMQSQSRARQQRIEWRLDKNRFPANLDRPMFRASKIQFEMADRTVATPYGGIALVHQFAKSIGLPEAIDSNLNLFKIRLPYHESDHVLNIALNAMCDGRCLEDMEWRRQDEAYLNLLGALRIPDPTTAGDFCRRFGLDDLKALQAAFDESRKKVWAMQPASFFQEAIIDADGSLVETYGECKQGMDVSYKGLWGYHPLAITLANTGESLRIVNRSGNRPSSEGAAAQINECILLCFAAGFKKIRLRGDTDFTQTTHLDGWDDQKVTFSFGIDVTPQHQMRADDLPPTAFQPLKRPANYQVSTQPRERPDRVKQQIVDERGYRDIRLESESVAETKYRPGACSRDYRLIILRKNLQIREKDQKVFFPSYRYFMYLTNDWTSTPEQIVFGANRRCQQENILAQLKAVRALHAPLDNLISNNAYMLIVSLAWNLKAWMALALPEPTGVEKEHQAQQKRDLLTMEFRTFVNAIIRVPAQVLQTGRRLVVRLLAWNRWQPVFLRLVDQLRQQPLVQ